MALLKSKPWKYGLTTEYWSIDEPNINYFAKTAHITVMGFRSENAKKVENEQPTETLSYDYSGDNFPFVKGENTEAKAYALVTENKLDGNGNETNFLADAISDEL